MCKLHVFYTICSNLCVFYPMLNQIWSRFDLDLGLMVQIKSSASWDIHINAHLQHVQCKYDKLQQKISFPSAVPWQVDDNTLKKEMKLCWINVFVEFWLNAIKLPLYDIQQGYPQGIKKAKHYLKTLIKIQTGIKSAFLPMVITSLKLVL